MHNLITFKQMDSDAERICNPDLIMGFQLVGRGLMHAAFARMFIVVKMH